ncbi:MAG: hypothetical protein RL139_638 [Gemmatimonadota bacterium]
MPRVVCITGAASGLGWALARACAARGDQVVLADRDAEGVAARAESLGNRGIAVRCDVTVPADRAALLDAVRQVGPLDVLINNAGITHRSPARDTDPEVLRRVMEVNYHAPVALTHAVLPQLRATRGSVVCIGSMAGWMPVPGRAGYGASKAALTQWAEVLRLEVARDGVHLLLAHPSFLDTPIEQHALGADGGPARHARSTVGRIRSADAEAARILAALDARRAEVSRDPLPAVAAWLWRLAPGVYRRLIARRFAGEL